MKIIGDVSRISKTVQRNLIFILNVLSESSIYLTLLLIVSHKMVFIENKTALLCVTTQKHARAFAATISSV